MSTSNTHQQSLVDAGSETRPPMLERGSYIPWASRFRRYLNRKRENRTTKDAKEEDLRGNDLKHYKAEIEAMNLILISIPNGIYNSVDACTTAKAMWQRYVTQVRLAKRLTVDSYDDLFDYLQQFEKLVNASRAKKLEKSHDPLALVAHTGSSSRITTPYYVTHPSLVVDYDDDYQGYAVQHNSDDPLTSAMILLARAITQRFFNPTNNRLRTSSNTRNQAIVQGTAANVQCYNCSEKSHYAHNCLKPRVQDSKYFMEQMLLAKQDETGYPKQPKIINNTIGDDQIDSNIIFDEPNEDVNSGSVEYDNKVQESYKLEQLARNAYKEAETQQIIAKKVQQQNTMLTKQLELYKEKVRVFEMTKENNTTYFNEYIEADRKAKHFEQESQYQFIHDRDTIRDLEQQRDTLELYVVEFKRQNVELQKTQSILKRRMHENEDKYHDLILDLKAKLKKNVDTMLKIGNSLQGMFMLGPKPMSFYDSQLKHGLGYANPYTLKKAISQNPKLYDASCLDDSKIHMNVRDTKDILDDATKSQIKMKNKMKDPIAIEKKQNVCTTDYTKLNALYENFIPQKKLSVEQKYFPSSFISSENSSNASSSYYSSETKQTVTPMRSANPLLVKCKYVIRNTGNGRKNEENTDSVTPGNFRKF
ncbi:retrovirus-related pol polyprotein from transposon TNT 1-94 [Tanacetum coccineum]